MLSCAGFFVSVCVCLSVTVACAADGGDDEEEEVRRRKRRVVRKSKFTSNETVDGKVRVSLSERDTCGTA